MEDFDLSSPSGRLRKARVDAKYADAKAFADAIGMKDVTYRAYEAGQNGFAKHVQRFASKLGVSVEWLLVGGKGGIAPNTDAPTLDAPESDRPPTRSVSAGETAAIARLDLSLPMGPGATVEEFVEDEPIIFDMAYVRSFSRTPPHRLKLAQGIGDSMFPTLVSADLVWIDTTQNQLLHSDRIYAASINGGAAIKRLRPIAGGQRVLVISDNKTIEPYEVDASDIHIWGRVIRFARDL